jgi:hypothetical protein
VSALHGYSSEVRRLFATAPGSGSLPPGPGIVLRSEAAALDRVAWVELELRLHEGRILDARFRAWGCPHLIAACALVTGRMVGQAPRQALRADPAELAAQLQAPPEKLGRLLVLEDAVRQLTAGLPEAK